MLVSTAGLSRQSFFDPRNQWYQNKSKQKGDGIQEKGEREKANRELAAIWNGERRRITALKPGWNFFCAWIGEKRRPYLKTGHNADEKTSTNSTSSYLVYIDTYPIKNTLGHQFPIMHSTGFRRVFLHLHFALVLKKIWRVSFSRLNPFRVF